MTPSRLAALAAEIQVNATKLDEFFMANGLPPPSFDEDAPLMYQFPPEVAAAQEALSAAIDELWALNQGPIEAVVSKALATSVGLKAILKYDIHNLVPLNVGTTFHELAEKTGVPERKLTRLLRQAITDHIFIEPRPGFIKHSAASKALVLIQDLPKWCEMGIYEVGPAKMHGYSIANNTEKTMFDFYEQHPERGNRFKVAMGFLQTFPGLGSSYVVKGFDWASLGKAKVVDVGGSHGRVSFDIAREYQDLEFIVQDLPKIVNEGEITVPPELAGRVTFMAHDFFTEQPVKDAKVYYFRWIFHDWSDKYCAKILRALIPAVNPGDKIILSERCLEPPCTLPLHQERWNRESDIVMMATSNSQERDENDYKELFRAADPRFKLEEVKRMQGAKLEIIVFGWE